MKQIKIIAVLFFAISASLISKEYSLKECINYARTNNSSIIVAKLDSAKSEKQIKEQIGTALPQIDANANFTDNVLMPTTLIPSAITGGDPNKYMAIKMGTQYNLTGTVSLTQKIFDNSFWVGLKAAKLNNSLSMQTIYKQEEQTDYNVISSYYRAVIIKKQLENLKEILKASEKTLKSMEIRFENGVVKKIDVDKIKVSYNRTKSQLEQTELNFEKAVNNLKFAMSMPIENDFSISDNIQENFNHFQNEQIKIDANAVNNRIDFQIQKTLIDLQEAEKDNYKASYMPTLSFFANYNLQAMRKEFDFFDTEKNWFSNSSIGVKLNVPIFSGFSKQARVEKSEIALEIQKENMKNLEQSINVNIANYSIQFKNAMENIQNEKSNLELAQSVFENTQIEFNSGKTSSLELTQAESSLRETQNNYYNKLLELYLAQLDLEKQKGTLNNFINNIK